MQYIIASQESGGDGNWKIPEETVSWGLIFFFFAYSEWKRFTKWELTISSQSSRVILDKIDIKS